MASIPATQIRKGMLIKLDNELWRILEIQHITPGNWRGMVKLKMRNLRTGSLSDTRLRSEDVVERETLEERQLQYLYSDSNGFHFMDTTSFDQYQLSEEALGDAMNYLIPESTVLIEFYGAEPVGVELPQTVDLRVEDTAPGIKGATASAQVKPAKLETGLVVQVPPFVNVGDVVRVNTETGEYQNRV